MGTPETRHHEDSSSRDEPLNFGERSIRELAARAGYRTLRRLALDAGIDRLTLRLAARGERTPTKSVVARLAVALRVTPDLLDQMFAEARERR